MCKILIFCIKIFVIRVIIIIKSKHLIEFIENVK